MVREPSAEHPLQGAAVKLNRATEHLNALNREVQEHFATEPYRTPVTEEGDGWYVARMEILEDPPVRWGAIVGDVAHNLRSALDHAVWELARRKLGREPTTEEARDIRFPVAKTERAFKAAPVLRYLSGDAVTALKRLQPYRPREGAQYTPIATLNWLVKAQQRTLLRGSYVALETADFATLRVRSNPDAGQLLEYRCGLYADDPVTDGMEVGRMRFERRGQDPQVSVPAQFPCYVAFGDVDHALRLSTLRRIHQTVVQALRGLEPLFE